VHVCLLDPDRTAPSTADEAVRQFTEGQVSTCMRPIGPWCAYGEAAPIAAVRNTAVQPQDTGSDRMNQSSDELARPMQEGWRV
jgi:hypothetical protein